MLQAEHFYFFLCCLALLPGTIQSEEVINPGKKCHVSNEESEIQIDLSLNSLEQDDPILIKAIQDRLIPPSPDNVPYNFTG